MAQKDEQKDKKEDKHLSLSKSKSIDWNALWAQVKKDQIETLDLTKSAISEVVFPDFELRSLRFIDMSYNESEIRTFKLPAKYFPNLTYLYLFEAKLQHFEVEGSLEQLNTLHLAGNALTDFSLSPAQLPKLEILYLKGNPLENIPKEVFDVKDNDYAFKNVWGDVGNYLKDFKKEDAVYLHEGKLILIGNGEVGKTSIRIRLLDLEGKKTDDDLPKQPDRTIGIDLAVDTYKVLSLAPEVTKLENPIDFELHIWDFGGQGKYREVQQLFCSRKSLYLFVTSTDDKAKESDYYVGYEYWLSMVNAFNYDKESEQFSPIIYVLNKIDMASDSSSKTINETDVQTYFKNVKDFVKIGCKPLHNFDSLRQLIRKHIPNMGSDIFKTPFKKSWIDIKEFLEKKQESGKTHLFYTEYITECEKKGINKDEAKTLINTLERMGYVVYYGDNPRLKDWIILSPLWIKDAIYKVLYAGDEQLNDKTIIKDGKLYPDYLSEIWKEYETPRPWYQRFSNLFKSKTKKYTNEEQDKLFELMLAYDFCYETKDNFDKTYYVVPALLPVERPIKADRLFGSDSLIYEIKFVYSPFIPAGTLNKLTVRLHEYIYSDWKWKNGVVLEFPNFSANYAEITESWQEKTVHLRLRGASLHGLYQLIYKELLSLNQQLKATKFLSKLDLSVYVKYRDKFQPLSQLKDFGVDLSDYDFMTQDSKSMEQSANKNDPDTDLKVALLNHVTENEFYKVFEKMQANTEKFEGYQSYRDNFMQNDLEGRTLETFKQRLKIFINMRLP
ncbi:MAG: leucine-rich repeat domain-containing protein [Bernardetiaceae bacterium]|nr:leucine-rich repeat domain-containing protein [Bernardetiaceae bacterium]